MANVDFGLCVASVRLFHNAFILMLIVKLKRDTGASDGF